MKIQINPEWLAHPINCTCEVVIASNPPRFCDKATTAAYPAMGGGWQTLCTEHAAKHLPDGAYFTDELITKGAQWK